MVKPPEKYEELRRQRLEENKKKMEQLNLPLLSQALLKTKPSPMKMAKPRTFRTELVPVRRSRRFFNQPALQYKEQIMHPQRDLSNRVFASDEARAKATMKAQELEENLGCEYPTFVKPMQQSHVTGGFWLDLPSYFCKRNLPKRDDTIKLVDECGGEWQTILTRKTGLSRGWKKFAVDHDLVDGDALVFQLIRTSVFKIHVIEGDVSRVETEPMSGLDVPAGDIQQLIPTLTGTSLSPSKFFAGVRDEEQNKARLKSN